MKNIFILLICLLFPFTIVEAQKQERAFIRKANKEFNDSSYNQAEIYYRKAIDVNPNSIEAYYNLGNLFFSKGEYDNAINLYDKALDSYKLNCEFDDKNLISKIYYNSGVSLHKQKKLQEAIEAYKEALKNNPQDNEARHNLTVALNELKKQQSGENDDNSQNEDNDKKDNQQNDNKQDNKSSGNNKEENSNNEENKERQSQNSDKNGQNTQEISDEAAENLLKSVLRDEKAVQEKVNREMNSVNSKDLEKNW